MDDVRLQMNDMLKLLAWDSHRGKSILIFQGDESALTFWCVDNNVNVSGNPPCVSLNKEVNWY